MKNLLNLSNATGTMSLSSVPKRIEWESGRWTSSTAYRAFGLQIQSNTRGRRGALKSPLERPRDIYKEKTDWRAIKNCFGALGIRNGDPIIALMSKRIKLTASQ